MLHPSAIPILLYRTIWCQTLFREQNDPHLLFIIRACFFRSVMTVRLLHIRFLHLHSCQTSVSPEGFPTHSLTMSSLLSNCAPCPKLIVTNAFSTSKLNTSKHKPIEKLFSLCPQRWRVICSFLFASAQPLHDVLPPSRAGIKHTLMTSLVRILLSLLSF